MLLLPMATPAAMSKLSLNGTYRDWSVSKLGRFSVPRGGISPFSTACQVWWNAAMPRCSVSPVVMYW